MKRCLLYCWLLVGVGVPSSQSQDVLGKKVIVCAPGDSSTFFYTNKSTAFYYGEACRPNSSSFQGFNVLTREYLEDYLLEFDGHRLERRTAAVHIYPDRLVRKYSPQQITEEVTLLDSLNVLAVKVSSEVQGKLALIPGFPGSRRAQDFVLRWEPEFAILQVGQRALMELESDKKVAAWTAVTSSSSAGDLHYAAFEATDGEAISKLLVAPTFVPGALQVTLRDSVTFFVIVGGDAAEVMSVRHHLDGNLSRLLRERQGRMQDVLDRVSARTSLAGFDEALGWAALSLDALIMNQQGRGIFAGLPWFNNYWGRDSFIALAGATLVNGNFGLAREILLSYAKFQLRDSTDWRDGRIPNRVMPGEIIYNAADGTGWFVRACRDYLHYSGDSGFAGVIYPVIERALAGAFRHRVDSLGFLTHRDAETWMDAVGPDGPWTPRGDRAVDIQALWYQELLAGIEIGHLAGKESHLKAWQNAAIKLKQNFPRYFWDPGSGTLVDHLNSDGSRDRQLRPNQFFALSVPSLPLLPSAQQHSILRNVVPKLVYPYGVASLWQGDEAFHPYHHHEPFYVQDAAYHNGTVWTWLSGPVISAMVAAGAESLAFFLMKDAAGQILHRGSYGTQSELLDATPHPGESYPRLSGTPSQAWNLAEFLRNWYQDFLGVRPDALRKSFTLIPALPPQLNLATFAFAVGSARVYAEYERTARGLAVSLRRLPGGLPLSFEIRNRAANPTLWSGTLQADHEVRVILRNDGNDKAVDSGLHVEKSRERWTAIRDLAFATPTLRADLPALRGPGHRLLRAAETRFDTLGAMLLVRLNDAAGDDHGSEAAYAYPRHSAFAPGIFDLRQVEIWGGPEQLMFRLRFENLVQPGWHPEYGFQLTYCAVALDVDGRPETGGRRIGRNAHVTLPPSLGCERVIYVGGGFTVAAADGKILAEYLPPIGSQPLGDVQRKAIAFAVPLELLFSTDASGVDDTMSNLHLAVFAGAQDDHGGSGVGEFRSVLRTASEWSGGGAESDGESSNVYDELLYSVNLEKME